MIFPVLCRVSISLCAIFLAVSCVGLSVHKQNGYTSDSFTQLDDIWFESKIQGSGPAADLLPFVSYGFEGPPFKAGIKAVDSSGLSEELIITSLVLKYADTNEEIFSSHKRISSEFKKYSGSEPPKSAEVYFSINKLVNPKDGRVIILSMNFQIKDELKTLRRTISNRFEPRNSSGVDAFTFIHD